MHAAPLLEVHDLRVDFSGKRTGWRTKDVKHAVDGVSFRLDVGETLGVVGESGSGKSTVGNAVLGLVRPTSGSIEFDAHDITHATPAQRRQLASAIQVVFQDPYSSLNPMRTVGATLTEPLVHSLGLSHSDADDRVNGVLERVGLSADAASRYPVKFSGGQRQRIAIARALVMEPRLVICDEPTSALDLSVQAQILNLLLELQHEHKISYLFISHDIDVIHHVSDRIVVMRHGQVVEAGDATSIVTTPRHPYTVKLLDSVPRVEPHGEDRFLS